MRIHTTSAGDQYLIDVTQKNTTSSCDLCGILKMKYVQCHAYIWYSIHEFTLINIQYHIEVKTSYAELGNFYNRTKANLCNSQKSILNLVALPRLIPFLIKRDLVLSQILCPSGVKYCLLSLGPRKYIYFIAGGRNKPKTKTYIIRPSPWNH